MDSDKPRRLARRVAIIHPWFPQYRVEFFEELHRLAASSGIELRIFHGDPSPELIARNDAAQGNNVSRLPTRFYRIGRRFLGRKDLGDFDRNGPYDLVILEQAIRNVETYSLLVRYRRRVAWWGHGRTYTAAKSGWEESVKSFLTNRGVWFFAYTRSGAAAVTRGGFDRDRITTVNNSTDTAQLREDVAAVDEHDVRTFMMAHDLTESTALYLGGLDTDKRIDMLLKSARMAHDADARFRLIVVGAGSLSSEVEAFAKENPWLVYLGPLFGASRAIPMRAAKILAIPGRVGLVAVDSFAANLPIITTDWPFHAPEFDYLVNRSNAVITEDGADNFSRGMLEVLQNDDLYDQLVNGCRASVDEYGVVPMAKSFHEGMHDALDASVRRPRKTRSPVDWRAT